MKYELRCKSCKLKHTLDTEASREYLNEGHTEYAWKCANCGKEIIAKTFWRRE